MQQRTWRIKENTRRTRKAGILNEKVAKKIDIKKIISKDKKTKQTKNADSKIENRKKNDEIKERRWS